MTRTMTYVEDAQVPEPVLDTVRDVLHSWHDPANDQVYHHLREEPTLDDTGSQLTDANGDPLYEVHIAASIPNVPEADIQTAKQNLVDAINTGLPDEWPTVSAPEITID